MTPSEIHPLLASLSTPNPTPFFSLLAPTVEWTVTGSSKLSGTYHSLEEFRTAVIERLNRQMRADRPVRPRVLNVIGSGEGEGWVGVELEFEGQWRDGEAYKQQYAWFLRFDGRGRIVRVRAYLDTLEIDKGLNRLEGYWME